ncbi:MAG: AMP-binding protein, partial [bacterium]|nr:AMP-binding protein [bacterium]
HHIISDGSSQTVLEKEFSALSEGRDLESLRLQYKDYSQWQNSEDRQAVMKMQEKYWLDQFPGELPVLHLPLDFSRPLMQSFAGRRLSFFINQEDTAHLSKLAGETGSTLYMVLLAVFNILLSKLGGGQDIIVGTPVAGRRHADLQNIIGLFLNTLCMRNYPGGHKRFTQFLQEVKQRTLDAYENQEYQFEDLVEKIAPVRNTSRNAIFDVLFNFLNLSEDSRDISGANLEGITDAGEGKTNFDISFQGSEISGVIHLSITYCSDLFKEDTIRRFIGYFKRILSGIREMPGIGLADIDMLSGEEKKRLLLDFNHTQADYPRDKTLHVLFREQAERTPDRTALVFNGHSLSYRQLDHWSNNLAVELREKGFIPGTIAAIMLERSVEMIIGIFAILKAGGAFLNLDPNYPKERIDFMLRDSAAKVTVTKGLMVDRLDGSSEPTNKPTNQQTNLAYIIYTSGSTGIPKGVVGLHSAMVNRSNWMWETYPFKPGEVCCQKTSLNFVDCIWEIFGPLLNGVPLVIIPEDVVLDLPRFVDILKTRHVSRIVLVPGLLYRFF